VSEELTELFNELEELLTRSGRVPFSGRLMVEEERAVDMLDRLRASVPEEIRRARAVLREREQILEQARRQAQRIAEQAQREAAMRLEEDGLMAEAKERSDQILGEARREAEAIRRGADGYAREVLTEIEARLKIARQEIAETLGRFLISVRKGLDALDEAEIEE
jgi:F0F1-type ATP synthase membrane subunit b/b'